MHKYNLLVGTPVMRALTQNKTLIKLLTKYFHSLSTKSYYTYRQTRQENKTSFEKILRI